MTFKDLFPSLPHDEDGFHYIGYTPHQIQEHCLDKQRVKEAIKKQLRLDEEISDTFAHAFLNDLLKELGLE